jgi:hypothetical protein
MNFGICGKSWNQPSVITEGCLYVFKHKEYWAEVFYYANIKVKQKQICDQLNY